jgi:ABC-2 type transport system permease protein
MAQQPDELSAVATMWRPLWAIVRRELKWTFRQRGRLVSAMVRPLLWLFTVGVGFEAMLGQFGPGRYRAFLVPGLLGMVVLFGAMLASLSLVYDKESGVMRMLIIAPFAHYWIVIARTLSATVVAVIQALLLLVLLGLLGYIDRNLSVLYLGVGIVSTALACAAMGILIAVSTRGLDNFAVIMNFVIFPVFFLSGALYPVEHLPVWLKLIASLNPFSYGVDLLKHATVLSMPRPFGADFSVGVDLAVLGSLVTAKKNLQIALIN